MDWLIQHSFLIAIEAVADALKLCHSTWGTSVCAYVASTIRRPDPATRAAGQGMKLID